MAAIDDQIAELEGILNRGVSSVNVDGQTVNWDLAAVRRRLIELRRERDPSTRPIVSTINTGTANP